MSVPTEAEPDPNSQQNPDCDRYKESPRVAGTNTDGYEHHEEKSKCDEERPGREAVIKEQKYPNDESHERGNPESDFESVHRHLRTLNALRLMKGISR